MKYSEKLKDPRWQQMRLRVYERDGWKCRSCGSDSETLHAHHAAYHPFSEGPWDCDEDTVITLCVHCHAGEHEGVKSAQANILLTLAKLDVWSTSRLECAAEIISSIDFQLSSPDNVVMKGRP